MWMEEALRRSKLEHPPSIGEDKIIEYLAYALYQQDNIKRLNGINCTYKLLIRKLLKFGFRALLLSDRLFEIGANFIHENYPLF